MDETPSLYGRWEIRPPAVKHGRLANSWFLAATAALSEYPERIVKIFNGITGYPKNGQINVNFWLYGDPLRVTVDDRLPGSQEKKNFELVNTRQPENESWWIPVLEKAAAKAYGTYENLGTGFVNEAFFLLTGMPVIEYKGLTKLEDKKLYDLLHDIDEDDHSIVAIASPTSNESLKKNLGYTITQTKVYNGEQLIKLRNPWGPEVFKGDWSKDNTEKWTAEAVKELEQYPIPDGAFWMTVPEFKQNFGSFVVNMYQDWFMDQKDVEWDRNEHPKTEGMKWTFKNPKAQKVVIGLSGASDRMFLDNKCKTHQKLDLLPFSLTKVVDGQEKLIVDSLDNKGVGWLKGTPGSGFLLFEKLEEGEYTITTRKSKLKPKYSGKMPFTVQTWGEEAEAKLQ